jgi:hypothetical protein
MRSFVPARELTGSRLARRLSVHRKLEIAMTEVEAQLSLRNVRVVGATNIIESIALEV